jgi:trimethylamine---corrinoid protein Co-methyltransferase
MTMDSRRLALTPLLTEAERDTIYSSALELLRRLGLLCNHAETLEYYQAAGCEIGPVLDKPVASRRVKFSEEVVADALAKATKQFTLYPTAPGYPGVELMPGRSHFVSEGGDYIWDYRTGQLRPGTMADMLLTSRLADACEHVSAVFTLVYWMYDLVPQDAYERYGLQDIHLSLQCLHCGKPKIDAYGVGTATEVPTWVSTLQLCAGGADAFRERPNGALTMSCASPLFLGGIVEKGDPWGHADSLCLMAKAGGPIGLAPAGNLGASAPATPAGLVTQAVAEVLALNVAVQTANPGNPIIFNDYTGSTDMATGTKAEVRPEAAAVRIATTEMAQHLGLPTWTINSPAAVEADAQFAWEAMAIYMSQYLAGVNMIGSMGGLCIDNVCDPGSLLMSNEMAGWVKHFARDMGMGEEEIATDLMVECGTAPDGGNFLGERHTLKHFREVNWKPSALSNALDRDAWLQAGSVGIHDRASAMMEEILATHTPAIPDSLAAALRDNIAAILEREGVGGDEAKKIMDATYWQGPS